MRQKHPLRRRWLFLAYHVGARLARWLPLSVARALGGALGYAAYGLLGRYRALTWTHLRQALGPRLSNHTCRCIARGVFVNVGKTGMEWFALDRCSPTHLRRLVDMHGLAHLRHALAKGRGVIALSAHLGNWEVLAMTLASAGFAGGVLARRLRYPEYERFLWAMRQRKGVATHERGSVTDVARLLRANQIVGMMPDQDIDSLESVFVEFFDRPTSTPVGPAALSLMTGAPIVPCFCIRRGRGFQLVIEEPIVITRTDDRMRDLQLLTQHWSRVVESYIRRYPDQWVWMHRRWKTAPADEQRPATSDQRPATSENSRHRQPAMALGVAVCAAWWAIGSGAAPAAESTSVPPDKRAAHSSVASAAATKPVRAIPATPPSSVGDENASTGQATQQMDSFAVAGYAADGAKRWDLYGTGAVVEGEVVTIQHPNAIGYDLSDAALTGAPAAGPTSAEQTHATTVPAPSHASSSSSAALQTPGTSGAHPSHSGGAGRTTYLTARLAQVNQTTHRTRLENQVTIHTSDGLWFLSPVMYWLPDQDQCITDQAVRLESDHMLLRGFEAVAHPQLKYAIIQRDIDLILNPSNHDTPGARGHAHITCDGPLTFDYEHNVATFERNVHVQDPQGELFSDTLIAYLDNATRTITYAEAIGHVRMLQGLHTALGERAVYEPAKSKITLLGSPSLFLHPDERDAGLSPFGGLPLSRHRTEPDAASKPREGS